MATSTDCIQIALEETPRYEGATTAAPYRLSSDVSYMPIQSANMVANPTLLDRSDELRGINGSVSQIPDLFGPTGSLAVRGYMDILPWLFSIAGLKGVYTAGAPSGVNDPDGTTVGTGANRWVFDKRGGLTAKSVQMLLCYVSSGIFLKGQGFGITRLGGDAGGAVTADMTGLVYTRISDPNLSPSSLAGSILPMRRGDLSLTWLGSTATTQDFTWEIANPLTPRQTWSLASPSFFPDVLEQSDERVTLTGTIPKSSIAAADIDNLMSGATFQAKARWKSTQNVPTSSTKYAMWIEMPACQYLSGSTDDLANRRRFGSTFGWSAAWDTSAGYDFRITLVNAVTSIDQPGVGL